MSKKHIKNKKKKTNHALKKILDLGVFLLVVLVITYILSNYVIERIVINNYSMEPTLFSEDSVLIDKLTYRFDNPQRFDVIVFKQNKTGEELIKRVIGLPYETVEIKDGSIYIDGKVISDVKGLAAPDYAGNAAFPIHLSEGEYFVLGDNRKDSIDSRYEEVGLVTNTRIIGRAFLKLFPINKIKTL